MCAHMFIPVHVLFCVCMRGSHNKIRLNEACCRSVNHASSDREINNDREKKHICSVCVCVYTLMLQDKYSPRSMSTALGL